MNRLQYLLSKLAEEAAEVAQIALKSQQFGLDDVYDHASNKERLSNELNDLQSIVKMINKEFNTDFKLDKSAFEKKRDKVNRYYEYSIRGGHSTCNTI